MGREGISGGQASLVFLHSPKREELGAMLPSPLAKLLFLPGARLAAGRASLGPGGLEVQSHFK